jgi:1,4-dihydroxy-2-naphthoyl-CoA synthase
MSERLYAGRPAGDFDFQYIRYEKAGYRATITFNRPEVYNCVNGLMLREINTIGSKANDASIQKLVVMMKDELEKIKEQTNNVL